MNGPLVWILPPRRRTRHASLYLHWIKVQLPAEAVELLPAHVVGLWQRLTQQDLPFVLTLEAHDSCRASRPFNGEAGLFGPVLLEGRDNLANSGKGYHRASKGAPHYAGHFDTGTRERGPGRRMNRSLARASGPQSIGSDTVLAPAACA